MSDFIPSEVHFVETNGTSEQSHNQQSSHESIKTNSINFEEESSEILQNKNVAIENRQLERKDLVSCDEKGNECDKFTNIQEAPSTTLTQHEEENNREEIIQNEVELHQLSGTNNTECLEKIVESENLTECDKTQFTVNVNELKRNHESEIDKDDLSASARTPNQTLDSSSSNKILDGQLNELNVDHEKTNLGIHSDTVESSVTATESNNANQIAELSVVSKTVELNEKYSTNETVQANNTTLTAPANEDTEIPRVSNPNEDKLNNDQTTCSSEMSNNIASSSQPIESNEGNEKFSSEPDDSDLSYIAPDEELAEDAILGPYSNEECDENSQIDESEGNSDDMQYETVTESDNESAEAIIADEYILTELPEHTESNKKVKRRRRILMYNDGQSSESSDLEEEREKIRSPSPSVDSVATSMESNAISCIESEYDSNDSLCNVVENDRPGPKSRKQSTKILKEIEARTLLKNAIIIPIQSELTKRKKRVIDSDDEGSNSEAELQSHISLDDIGIEESQDVCAISDDDDVQQTVPKIHVKSEVGHVIDVETNSNNNINLQIEKPDNGGKDYTKVVEAIKLEPICELHEEKQINRDSGNSTDSIQKQYQQVKNNLEIPLSVPIFGDSSGSDDGYVPNDVYFGTPVLNDHSIARKRGRYPGDPKFNNGSDSSSSSNSIKQKLNLSYSYNPKNINWNNFLPSSTTQKKKKKKKHLPNELYFDSRVPLHVLHAYDDSSSSDEPMKSIEPNPTFKEAMAQLNKCGLIQINKRPSNQNKKNAPNRVQQRQQQKPQQRPQQRRRPQQKQQNKRKPQKKPQKQEKRSLNNAEHTNPFEANEDDLIKTMKMYLHAAGLKRVNLTKLCTGCTTSEERANRMLNLLHEKGLEGEPTMEKCRQLKEELRLRREIEGLDPNVIIQGDSEGRTRRSSTRTKERPRYTFNDDEPVQETLKKIRQIIDSDSESD